MESSCKDYRLSFSTCKPGLRGKSSPQSICFATSDPTSIDPFLTVPSLPCSSHPAPAVQPRTREADGAQELAAAVAGSWHTSCYFEALPRDGRLKQLPKVFVVFGVIRHDPRQCASCSTLRIVSFVRWRSRSVIEELHQKLRLPGFWETSRRRLPRRLVRVRLRLEP